MNHKSKITGSMRAWAEAQIAEGRFVDEDAAIEAGLISLADREARIANLNALIQQGLDDVSAGRVHEYSSPEDAIKDIMRS